MADVRLPDGRIIRFPDGMDPAAMGRAVQGFMGASGATPSPPTPPAPPSPPTPLVAPPRMTTGMDYGDPTQLPTEASLFGPEYLLPEDTARPSAWSDVGQIAGDIVASGADGLRQGVSAVAGMPVDLINMSPMLMNLLPGDQGMTPFTENPVGGSQNLDWLLRFGGAVEDYEPETMAGRFTNRVTEELGATAVPVGAIGALARASGPIASAIKETPIGSFLTRPMERMPGRIAAREAGLSVASGTGAQIGNELQSALGGDNDGEGTWWSDLAGSVLGMATVPTAATLGRAARNVTGAFRNDTRYIQPEVRARVADTLIDNSSTMQQQASALGIRNVDTDSLAEVLRRPSLAENVIPGFRANIGDRVDDPGLSTLAYNVDGASPGASALRRRSNAEAVDNTMRSFAPDANPATFREALQFGSDQRIGAARADQTVAARTLDDAIQNVEPSMSPVVRGTSIRGGLDQAYDTARADVAARYGQIDQSQPADMRSLREAFDARTESLPFNDRDRFLPSEVGTLRRNVPDGQPVASGVLGPNGQPIMKPPPSADMPLAEAMAVRSGLSSDIRSPAATSQARNVTGGYMDTFDQWLETVLPADQRQLYDAARASRLDVGRRFEDVGPIPDILRTSGRDQTRMADEAVAPRAMRSEDDLTRVLNEVGTDQAARDALADQVRDDALRARATRSPEALARFLQDRNFALTQFPEVRTALEAAGTSRQQLADAERILQQTERQYAPGATSPTGQYLRYDDTNTRTAMATAWKSARPEAAIRELLDVAGDTPATREAARSALWEEVANPRNASATPSSTPADGIQQWNGRALRQLFDDPRFSRVADVLWEDNPQHLSDLREVVEALSRSEGSTRARAPGTSGSGQVIAHDQALTSSSIASTLRSVNRGQLSPTIAGIDLAGRFLRRSSATLREKAYRELMAEAINNPDLAAELLIKYNPADEAAFNQRFLGLYGARLPTLANILAGEMDEDPLQSLAGDD